MHWQIVRQSPQQQQPPESHATSAQLQHNTAVGRETFCQSLQMKSRQHQRRDLKSTRHRAGALSSAMKCLNLSQESHAKQHEIDSAFDVSHSAKGTALGSADSLSQHDDERDLEAGTAGAPRPHLQGVMAFGSIYLTHNGDFQFYRLFGQDRTPPEMQVWLAAVLGCPAPAVCDSAAIAGLFPQSGLRWPLKLCCLGHSPNPRMCSSSTSTGRRVTKREQLRA